MNVIIKTILYLFLPHLVLNYLFCISALFGNFPIIFPLEFQSYLYSQQLQHHLLIKLIVVSLSSFQHNNNKIGLNTEPCGTESAVVLDSDVISFPSTLLNIIDCVLSQKYDLINFNATLHKHVL